jgi:hypothetical protein
LEATRLTGYLHPDYAASLAEFGRPRHLPDSGGWIIERSVPDFDCYDGMGCYPLFSCCDWSKLYRDLEDCNDRLITLSLVTDPFGEHTLTDLSRCFSDLVVPFKEHLVADLRRARERLVSKHHRHYARKALERVKVERCKEPSRYLDEWTDLYQTLTRRHGLKGIKAFSRTAFARQLSIPGVVMLRATSEGVAVGAHLWYVQGEVAYSHLAASSSLGYELMSSYALHWSAIDYFADEVRWLDWGAGAGLSAKGSGGLHWFKQGWSTGARTTYLCGRIFDRQQYARILDARGASSSAYFPAYREGEF